MKAAIYTRVSSDSQAEGEFNSCEAQTVKIRSFISSQENMDEYKVYSDEGYTGANTDRPALQEMLSDIQQGNINVIISYKIDRLTRSPKDFYQLIEIFEKHNASFISITERFDTSTPSGRLLRNIMLTFGQFERELTSERIRDKKAEMAKKGMWSSGKPPFGYKTDNRKLIPEPVHSETVKKMFETYVTSGSLYRTYDFLKSGKMLNRSGGVFSKGVIYDMLRNAVYNGMILHKGNIYKGIHEPLVSHEMFEEAQKVHKPQVRGRVVHCAIFPGLVHCKCCGSTMSEVFTNKSRNNKRVRYFYYRCSRVNKFDKSFCDIRQASVDRLDRYIIENLDTIAKNKQYLDSLIFTLNNSPKPMASGLEPGPIPLQYTSEKVREILKTITGSADNMDMTERRIIMKRHISKIIYSKEEIEILLNYSGSGAEPSSALKTAGAAAGKNSSAPTLPASFFCPHPKKSRRPLPDSKRRKNFHETTVRSGLKMELNNEPQTLLIIIPNTVHGCKKLNIGRL
jgi:site-specific DNA recombinase